MSTTYKILSCGDVKGKFATFFKKVRTVNAKNGPFEMIVCVGDFFGDPNDLSAEDLQIWNEVKTGKVQVPAPIYLLGPLNESQKNFYPDIEGCELAPDVIYLGRIGIKSLFIKQLKNLRLIIQLPVVPQGSFRFLKILGILMKFLGAFETP